eukprot:g27843.t1
MKVDSVDASPETWNVEDDIVERCDVEINNGWEEIKVVPLNLTMMKLTGVRYTRVGVRETRSREAGKLGHVDLRCAIVNQKVDAGLVVNEKCSYIAELHWRRPKKLEAQGLKCIEPQRRAPGVGSSMVYSYSI